MTNKQQKLIPDSPEFAREVLPVPIEKEMSDSFLSYSLSVITSRAIPEVRDGLKPVQRRILYAMFRMGLRPDSPHRKSARVVGETMGRYHPHGDAAIYDTLVRMGQNFGRGITLVEPQGNFGSLDDPPAAPRYTECRLTEASMAMIDEIDENTVDFRPTYDGESAEPTCLPALLPNLLLNGTTGIAVGMATNMPTHNLNEIYEAISLVMKKRRPKPTIHELMNSLPGPDFPSGGIIINEGLEEAYKTGRGSIRLRARTHVEPTGRNRQAIVITELPYLVGPERVISKLKELDEAGKITGVADFKNLSDRLAGLRIQIIVKSGYNPQAVLSELYRLTPLEETFGINNVVLVDGEPRTLGIYDLCKYYIDHRLDVVVRRTNHRLEQAKERRHIVDGLLTALDAIDKVVKIIRGSKDTKTARANLMKNFKLSEVQTNHILDMPLKRLTALEFKKLEEERTDLKKAITDYQGLLKSEKRQQKLVLDELGEATAKFGRPRRTEIISPEDLPVFEPVEENQNTVDEPCVITLSTSGQVGKLPTEGGNQGKPGRHDVLVTSLVTRTTETISAITSEGRVLQIKAGELSDGTGRTRGANAAQVFGTNSGETVLTAVADGNEFLVLITKMGTIKRLTLTEIQETKSGKTAIKLKPGDSVVSAFCSPKNTDIVIVASDAQVLRTSLEGISIQGRGASGVAGIKLRSGATVIGAGAILGDEILITVTNDSSAKVTSLSDFENKGRGGVGVRATKLNNGVSLIFAKIGLQTGLLAVMGSDDDPKKIDPNPVTFLLESTKRDLVSTMTERQILILGPARW